MMSMITATAWVPRGYAAASPIKYNVDEKELARISKLAKLKLEDAKEDLERVENGKIDEQTTEEEEDEEDDGVRLPQSVEYYIPP
jgi:periodic tryptophan protein 1